MAWIRVESSVARNRKFLEAGPSASWLWLCGVAYAQEGLTDGFIPFQALSMLGVKSAEPLKRKLVTAGLWDEVPGGWQIHDYLKHNRSAADVRRIQDERREAGKHGGTASGEARRQQPREANASSKPEATREPIISTATETATEQRVTRATLVAPRRKDAAWEGAKGLYVPMRKHRDFIDLRNHSGAEGELFAWYADVAATWSGSPGADMFAFWTARFNEKWPPPAAQTRPDPRRPAWATP